jgi:Protein of unknown function (DUF3606)
MAKRKKKASKKASRKATKKHNAKSDRARISGKQPYEVYYVARKFGVSPDTVRRAIKKVGHMRVKVYTELEKHV